MNGRNSLNNFFILLLIAACLAVPHLLQAATGQSVAILLSDDEEAYYGPIVSFSAEMNLAVETFNLKGDIERAPTVMAEILRRQPSLILALGAKAAVASKIWTADHPDIPVIFAMVLNWERYDLFSSQKNIAGIAYDVAPGTNLANLAMISPGSNRVGIIYNKEHSKQVVESARKAAEILDLKIVEREINSPQEFQRAFKSIEGEIDSYWILPDPVVYTLENISWLEKRCIADRIICLGSSENVAKLGIVLSVDPDQKNIGVQAASMARSILQYRQDPGKIGVMSPLGTRLFINLKTAGKIGLKIGQNALDQATAVIE